MLWSSAASIQTLMMKKAHLPAGPSPNTKAAGCRGVLLAVAANITVRFKSGSLFIQALLGSFLLPDVAVSAFSPQKHSGKIPSIRWSSKRRTRMRMRTMTTTWGTMARMAMMKWKIRLWPQIRRREPRSRSRKWNVARCWWSCCRKTEGRGINSTSCTSPFTSIRCYIYPALTFQHLNSFSWHTHVTRSLFFPGSFWGKYLPIINNLYKIKLTWELFSFLSNCFFFFSHNCRTLVWTAASLWRIAQRVVLGSTKLKGIRWNYEETACCSFKHKESYAFTRWSQQLQILMLWWMFETLLVVILSNTWANSEVNFYVREFCHLLLSSC